MAGGFIVHNCGTPVVSTSWGVFPEVIINGLNGFRCQTLREWLDAIEACKTLDRRAIAQHARAHYSLEAVGPLYTHAFEMIANINKGGWYHNCPDGRADIANRNDLGAWLTTHKLTGTGAEIGVFQGANAKQILSTWPGYLLLVDPWKAQEADVPKDCLADYDFDSAFADTLEKLKDYRDRFEFMRMTSDEAANSVADGSLDFVYLDGKHYLPQIRRDIERWWLKVKPGGLFCGHDYCDRDEPGFLCEVKTEVDRFVAENNLQKQFSTTRETGVHTLSWLLLKPKP